MNPRILAASLCAVATAFAGSADEDWQAVLALDAGPQAQARSASERQSAVTAHLAAQDRALRTFVSAHAADARAFEARLRMSRLLSMRGEIFSDEKARAEAARMLEALEKIATPEQRTELDFARLSQTMRRINAAPSPDRDALLSHARKFQKAHPEDRRVPEILAEVSTLFDSQPAAKRKLLLEAQPLAGDDELKSRIADDLRRLDLLGQPIALSAPSTDGSAINLETYRGRVVIVCFFATWSAPSILALDTIKRAVAPFSKDRVQVLAVSLDTKPEPLGQLLKSKTVAWPVIRDGQGWESPLIRGFGINALPTVWLLDREGKLRSLDALENTGGQIRRALGDK